MQPTPPPPCPLTVCVLASGSKGNAIYVEDGETAILVDAGLSGVEIRRRMEAAGLEVSRLKAIVVSHEHNDHIRGVGVLARRYDLPVYMSPGCAKGGAGMIGRIENLVPFETGKTFRINGLAVHPFSTSHDARDPAGFTISVNDRKIGIATDLGVATGMVKQHLKSCNLLVLEANHDPRMLIEGPYPWPLKQRIQSRNGHLSNEASRDLLGEIKHSGLCHVILAHLSETNNTPEKALAAVEQALGEEDSQVRLHVACQDRCSDLLILS
ncbi:MAG: MBL fold metallo-hydrolase [Desulfosarcinaceae bacterium]